MEEVIEVVDLGEEEEDREEVVAGAQAAWVSLIPALDIVV